MGKKLLPACLAAVLLFWARVAGAAVPNDEGQVLGFTPKLGGYIEAWYRNDGSDLSNQATSSKKVDNEFRVRRARITAKGNVTGELGYKLTASLDGPSPGSSPSSAKLWDAYISYTADELLKVTAGQFKYDFTLEGLESTTDRIPVLRAESINDIAGKLGTAGGSFRDIGVKVNGTYKKALGLTYGVAVINGSGINTGDNNGSKDVVGRVTITPVEDLTVGASVYVGKGQNEGVAFEVKESAWCIDAEYRYSGVKLRGEYIAARWKNWDASTSAALEGRTERPKGWYVQASYRLPVLESLEVMGRYEEYEKDSDTAESTLKTTTTGLTYHLKGKTRITANYLFRDAGSSPVVKAQETNATGGNIGDLFLLQAILVF